MKTTITYTILTIIISLNLFCRRVTEATSAFRIEHFFYPADSTEKPKTAFTTKQDIFFHFGIINTGNMTQKYEKSHGGTPLASFEIFKGGSLVATSDDGYDYGAVIVPGELAPGDTLKYSTSWNSNPFHNPLPAGNYLVKLKPYIYIQNIVPSKYLDSINLKIVSE